MKNAIRSLALVLSIAFYAVGLQASTPTANPTAPATVKVGSVGKKLLLSVTDTEAQDMRLTIENTEGVVLHATTVKLKGTTYSCRFNLQNLEAGDYRLVIKKKREKLTQPFEVTYKHVIVSEAQREQVYLPQVTVKDALLDVSVLQDKVATIKVTLFDNAGIMVFDTEFDSALLHKRFNLSRLPKGVYILEVAVQGQEAAYFTVNL
jgi:hypothetical protein